MYTTSTQKKHWTFADISEVEALRQKANDDFKNRYRPVVEDESQKNNFLLPSEEALLCRIVTETGIRNGNRESNIDTIMALEPALISKLKYHLTVHCPFRPLEGHFITMKTRCMLTFDLETIRPQCNEFLKKALVGDVMLLYPPSQIALAALLYGLRENGIKDEFLRKYLVNVMEIDTLAPNAERELSVEKLQLKLDDIIALVLHSSETPINPSDSASLQTKMRSLMEMLTVLDAKMEPLLNNESTEPFDSDDDF